MDALRYARRIFHPFGGLLCLWLALVACRGGGDDLSSARNALVDPFLPPTIALPTATPTSLPLEPETEPAPSPTPSCSDLLTFLDDVTIPDGTVVLPGEKLDKRWQVQNTGTCNWDDHYRLKLSAGPDLGASPDQALYPARGGGLAVIRILFTAPLEAGNYRSAWQAYTPDGKPFGDPFFIEIVVQTP